MLANSGPGSLVSDITAPTLLIQGTVDELFPLQQAVTNEQLLAANSVPVKMIWFCGGHGICLDPGDPLPKPLLLNDKLAWLNQYVKQDPATPADAIPTFQWVDQNGNFFSSNLMPSNPSFQGTPVTASSAGGTLPIVPHHRRLGTTDLGPPAARRPSSRPVVGRTAAPAKQCAEPHRAGVRRDQDRGGAGADVHLFRHRDQPQLSTPRSSTTRPAGCSAIS